MSVDHVQRQCPHFICKRYGEQGHTMRRYHIRKCERCKEYQLKCICYENDDSDETSYDGRYHFNDYNADRHGNDELGNGYGRNRFEAPSRGEFGRRKEKEDLECDNCGKINCYVCDGNKCICLCIKSGHFPSVMIFV